MEHDDLRQSILYMLNTNTVVSIPREMGRAFEIGKQLIHHGLAEVDVRDSITLHLRRAA